MPMAMADLRQQLSAIEPSEAIYEGIDASAVPALRELLKDEEPWLAARAAHALSRIDDPAAEEALVAASTTAIPEVRVAIASEVRRAPTERSNRILPNLLDDADPGVRKFAIKSVAATSSSLVKEKVQALASTDPVPELRKIAEAQSRQP